jgi:hypothetical protein
MRQGARSGAIPSSSCLWADLRCSYPADPHDTDLTPAAPPVSKGDDARDLPRVTSDAARGGGATTSNHARSGCDSTRQGGRPGPEHQHAGTEPRKARYLRIMILRSPGFTRT